MYMLELFVDYPTKIILINAFISSFSPISKHCTCLNFVVKMIMVARTKGDISYSW